MTRTDLGSEGGSNESRSVRIMVHTAGNDLQNHPTAWKTVADKICVDDPRKEKNRWGLPRLQFNGMTNWIYEGVYFGLMDVYTMDKSDSFDGFDYQTRHDDDYMDFYIGTSRDGLNFDKSWIYARKPLVPRGPAGAFDKDGIKPPSQIVTYNDEHWIYYGGMSERHYSRGRDYPGCITHGRQGGDALRKKGNISMYAVRAGDIVGIHSVIFSTLGETVTLGHDAHSRDGFARGALLGAGWLVGKDPGMYTIADVLGLK